MKKNFSRLSVDIKSDKLLLQKAQEQFFTRKFVELTRQDFLTEEYWDRYLEWLNPIEETKTYGNTTH
jgi:hypothetical protein